jgi:hypothetical protein
MKYITIFFCFLISGCVAKPFMFWTNADTARQAIYTVVHIMDWSQTTETSRKPKKYKENNPILGKHPSETAVHIYMFITLLLQTAIPAILKPRPRKWYQIIWIGIESYTVYHNFTIGLIPF